MAGLDQGRANVEAVDFVEHTFNQPLDGIFTGAVKALAWDAQAARGGAENEIAAVLAVAEVGQRQLDDVEGAHEISLELIADFGLVLVLAGANDAVSGAVGDDVETAKVRDGLFDGGRDGGANADVTEQSKVSAWVRVPLLQRGRSVD